jgi:hypothetical protein
MCPSSSRIISYPCVLQVCHEATSPWTLKGLREVEECSRLQATPLGSYHRKARYSILSFTDTGNITMVKSQRKIIKVGIRLKMEKYLKQIISYTIIQKMSETETVSDGLLESQT